MYLGDKIRPSSAGPIVTILMAASIGVITFATILGINDLMFRYNASVYFALAVDGCVALVMAYLAKRVFDR